MDDRPVKSSLEWTRCVIEGAIDDDAEFITIGVMAHGGARVLVDGVSFEVIAR